MTDTITLPRSVVEQALKALGYGGLLNQKQALAALRAALDRPQVGEVVVTTNQQGHCVAVTRQDDEGQILSVIWEAKKPQVEQEPVACLVRTRSLRTPSNIAADGKNHFCDWGEWRVESLSYGIAVIDEKRNSGPEHCYEMKPLYTHPQPPALEQPQGKQEPVAVVTGFYGGFPTVRPLEPATVLPAGMALYTRPQPPRQPLTDEWVRVIYDECDAETGDKFIFAFARAIEAPTGSGVKNDQDLY